ncbi:MAG: PAS domain-containing protein [Alkalinema sp. FL-bin-369]|nr:PAS domain-containing protein [Leptolyngbyaceae cyanobacterium LF-bin-369]
MSVMMSFQTFTVLIVEDLITDRELYRRALRGDSNCVYHVLEAESVAAGLALCQTQSIDAVLLDYALPDGNGLDFLAQLSAQTSGINPPVVMISGRGNEKTAVRAIKLGAEDYLVKSDLTTELLLVTIRSAIENTLLKQQLQKQEERFRASVENMIDCFGIYSAIRDSAGQIVDFRFDYQNAAAMQSNRMTDADMDKTTCEMFPAFRETRLFAEHCQVVETGIPRAKDNAVYTDVFGGERLTKSYDVQIAKLDDGFTASWRDITAQKQLELSLTAANQQIATIWESMTDAYMTIDPDWRFTYANSTATQMINELLKSPIEDTIGKIYWDVFPWTVGTIVDREYHRAVSDQVAVHFELFYEPAKTWFEINAYPSKIGLGIYFRNINDRKWLECERLAAEQERDRFFEVSVDLLVVVNLDGYFVRVNPACEQILGFTSAEIMAQPFIDFLHPDDIAASMAVFEGLGAANVLVDFENRYRCKDESYRWILWNAILDPERNLIYASGRDITDRKHDEERLRQSEEFNRRILESNRDCIKVMDLDGRLTYMNDYGQSLLEVDDFSTVAESQWLELWKGSDRELAQTAFSTALAGGVSQFDGSCVTNKGTPKWWEVIVTPILDADGQVSQILSVSRDITDRKQSAAFLQAQQETIQQQLGEIESIYQMAPIGLCYVDRDMKFVRVNEQLARMNGLPIAEHIGQTICNVLSEMAGGIERLYQQVIESGEPILDLEISGSTNAQPGVERHWLASYYPQTDVSGQVVGVNAMVQEITDRKIAAQRLQESEQQLRTGVEVAGIGLLKFDFAADQFELSPEAAALYGFARDTAVITREQLHATFHPDERAEIEAFIVKEIDQGTGSFARDHRIVWPNGQVCHLSVRTQLYFDRSGAVARPIYAIIAAIDITDRKQTQADLEKRNQELDSFVYVVSHDLKAPLRAVANLSQWIEDDLEGQLSNDNQSQMNLLRSRVQRMSSTIDGLLDYARCGHSDEEIRLVEVAKLLVDVIDSVDPPPTFTINLPTEMPTFFAKRLPLFQVLVNLIGNGIKHHHSEAGAIQISIEDHGDFYEFAIADNGLGIAPEHQEQMFKIFQAVNPQNRSDSTGIGLAIVKKTIEAEGGAIWLKSELGKGTTFYFTWLQR